MNIKQVRRFAMSLPGVTEEPHHNFSSFRIRGKIFVTVPPDEKHIHVFLDEAARTDALTRHSNMLELLEWGSKTIGVRITLRKARCADVYPLIVKAWRGKVPPSLVDSPPRE